tara:strand:- start:263 stop:589 length:327 start_codon:yes stop_codon:yes gene_type:complete
MYAPHIMGVGIVLHILCVNHTHTMHILAYIQMMIYNGLCMGEPPKSKRIHLRINSELFELLAERAKEENRSVTNMISTYLNACVGLPSSVVVERLNNQTRSRTRRKNK